jgi:hypothetical protein
MAVTARQSGIPAATRWHVLVQPRWLVWHAFVVLSTAGMFFLATWQLHRAESGNELSWAYTFEWPLFAAFTVFFWFKSLRDELRGPGSAASAGSDLAPRGAPATGMTTGATAPEGTARAAASGAESGSAGRERRLAASWDATSWDATNWSATSPAAGADGTGKPADPARATPADGEAYVARLKAEVLGPRRRRGRR